MVNQQIDKSGSAKCILICNKRTPYPVASQLQQIITCLSLSALYFFFLHNNEHNPSATLIRTASGTKPCEINYQAHLPFSVIAPRNAYVEMKTIREAQKTDNKATKTLGELALLVGESSERDLYYIIKCKSTSWDAKFQVLMECP